MAVTLPPWLNIDPIAPARIRLQANQQRNAAAASERSAQAQAEELQFRREALQAQQAQAAGREAADERAALRRDQVLRQTHDQELAQAAQQMQLRREAQAQKSQQFQQTLRLKQEAAEREAKSAAQQMQGMKAVQAGLQKGEPLQKLIAENAPMLFANHPERMPSAVPRGVTGPVEAIARDLRDEQGNPTGFKVRPGAGGALIPLPRTGMTQEGMMRQDQILAGIYMKQLETATGAEEVALQKKLSGLRDRIEKDIERRGTPAANSKTITIKSPAGKVRQVPVGVWESTPDEEKEGFEVVPDGDGEDE